MNTQLYRLSLGLTVLLTFLAFIFLFPWFGVLIKGVGRLPFLSLLPWTSLTLLALACINCIIRKRVILGR
jgi:hypothetical protein